MPRIRRDSLLTLEAYARERADFRARVLPAVLFTAASATWPNGSPSTGT